MKRFLLLTLFCLTGCLAQAQIWQAYRGIWLDGYDNATQAPIPPAGYSGITYFGDSLGTYVYDPAALDWLRIPGAGGGGLTGADNGNTVVGTEVYQGGSLIQNTSINGGGFSYSMGGAANRVSAFNAFAGTTTQANIQSNSTTLSLVHNNTTTSGTAILSLNQTSATPQALLQVEGDPANLFLRRDAGGGVIENELSLSATASRLEFDDNAGAVSSIEFTPITANISVVNSGGQDFTDLRTSGAFANWNLDITNGSFQGELNYNLNGWAINHVSAASESAILQLLSLSTRLNNTSGGDGMNLVLTGSDETGVLSSTGGSALTVDVNATTETRITTNANTAFLTSTGATQTSNLILDGDNQTANLSGQTAGAGLTVDYSVVGVTQVITAGDGIIFPQAIGTDLSVQTQDGATGTQSTGFITLRTGNVTSGTGDVGDIEIRLGAQAGAGSPGNIQIDATTGELIFTITRTDCTGAPSGAIANVSGVLNICP
jgi:hypothetical protein